MSNRYSTLFEYKLPSFIRDDPSYSRFIDFFNAYYEWFDDTYNILGFGDTLDIDSGFETFKEYFVADFLTYFPNIESIKADKVKLIKIVKELYKAKGIPDSFKFLFRVLYDINVDIYATNDYVLRASDGKWVVPKSIKIKSLDPIFLNINNFIVFGELSKTIGVIENSKINGKFTQIYLSNIERMYFSGETVRILDNKFKDVYFLNGQHVNYDKIPPVGSIVLTSKIIGSLSNIDINPKRRGQNYKVGDPVIISGGLNLQIADPIAAVGSISEVTRGELQRISVINGGYGYRTSPNSNVNVIYQKSIDTNAFAYISLVDETRPSNVSYITTDSISNVWVTKLNSNSYLFSTTANINSKLQDCFSFTAFSTYPAVDIVVAKSGTGYESTDDLSIDILSEYTDTTGTLQNINKLGILAPIQILNSGVNYSIGDTLSIIGGSGSGAFARIKTLSSNGAIESVEYYYNTNTPYPVGGMGYRLDNLPKITISSTTGSNANLTIPGILGSGITYGLETTKVGSITKISLTENGEDYISTPNVSLRVQDILVTGSAASDVKDTIVYQGNVEYPSFYASVFSSHNITNSISANTNSDIYNLRVYDYRGNISSDNLILQNIFTGQILGTLEIQSSYTDSFFKNGVRRYGDGSAKASAKFLNGIIVDAGRYLNSDGQLSAHSVLQNDVYNPYTYILTAEKDYNSYKEAIQNLTHPIGTKLIPRNLLKANTNYKLNSNSDFKIANSISDLNITIIKPADSIFSNTFNYSVGPNTYINIGTYLCANSNSNQEIYSSIKQIDSANNKLVLLDYLQYNFPGIYSGYSDGSSNVTITSLNYKGTQYAVNTFLSLGDTLTISQNTESVIAITNNIITLANTIQQIGSSSNTFSITIEKSFSTNNISIYTTV